MPVRSRDEGGAWEVGATTSRVSDSVIEKNQGRAKWRSHRYDFTCVFQIPRDLNSQSQISTQISFSANLVGIGIWPLGFRWRLKRPTTQAGGNKKAHVPMTKSAPQSSFSKSTYLPPKIKPVRAKLDINKASLIISGWETAFARNSWFSQDPNSTFQLTFPLFSRQILL